MRIRMLETRMDSEDGFVLREFTVFRDYDLADTLARYFIARGWAVELSGFFIERLKAHSVC